MTAVTQDQRSKIARAREALERIRDFPYVGVQASHAIVNIARDGLDALSTLSDPTPPTDMARALGYAQRLAISLWEQHWKSDAPDWKPLPDVLGVLTQIDNMTVGLTKAAAVSALQRTPVEISREWCMAAAHREGDVEVGAGGEPVVYAIDRSLVRQIVLDATRADEHFWLGEHLLVEIDKLPILDAKPAPVVADDRSGK